MTSSPANPRLTSLCLPDFLAILASNQPAPGGGSAAAFAGAMAGALVGMVARLTIGRERFAAHESQMISLRNRAEWLQERLMALVEEDALAYKKVMAAYSLPKANQSEIDLRRSAIQGALQHAAQVPLETAEACEELVELAAVGAARGNPNAASDAAVAALLAHAGMRGAVLNVRTNLKELQDRIFASEADARLGRMSEAGDAALARAIAASGFGE